MKIWHTTRQLHSIQTEKEFHYIKKIHPIPALRKTGFTYQEIVECGNKFFQTTPAICYDLRFPELFRTGLSMGANLL